MIFLSRAKLLTSEINSLLHNVFGLLNDLNKISEATVTENKSEELEVKQLTLNFAVIADDVSGEVSRLMNGR